MQQTPPDFDNIRAISLDLDDTLWPVGPTIVLAEQALLDWMHQHAASCAAVFADRAQITRLREQALARMPHVAHDFSAIRQAMIAQALHESGHDADRAAEAFQAFWDARQCVTLFDDVLPALQVLKQRFALAALTNGNADVHKVGLGEFFSVAVSARGFGIAKPDPRIFWETSRLLGVAPEQVLHVGDDAALDALAARQAGMPSLWLNREGRAWPHAEAAPWTLSSLTELVDHLPA